MALAEFLGDDKAMMLKRIQPSEAMMLV